MAEEANPPLTPPQEPAGTAPIEARKTAIRVTRDRMSANLDVLDHQVRSAVGVRDSDVVLVHGQRRAVNVVTIALTLRRLWKLPFWRLTAIGVATAGLVTLGIWQSRRDNATTTPISPS